MDEADMLTRRPPRAPDPPTDLTGAILARTSGDPCRRLHDLACAFVDGELAAGPADLVRLHLAHCEACTALVAALASLETTLPALAQVDPGPWFTRSVLQAARRLRPEPGPGAGRQGLWWRLMHRPRIALETAYLGAAACLVGLHLPLPRPHLDVPALVQPVSDPARRVADQLVEAERRSAASLELSVQPVTELRWAALARPAAWRRAAAWFQDRLPGARPAPPPPGPEGKKPPPANPD